jgi:hypothetical protein
MKALLRIFCALVLLTVAACDLMREKNDPVVVSVGDAKLYLSDIHKQAPEWDSWTDRERLAFLERWIDEETMFQEALDRGFDKDPVLSVQIEQTVRKMLVDRFLQSFEDTMVVGDAERIDYYNAHKEEYLRGKTLISGAQLLFRDWGSADAYYRANMSTVFDSIPPSHYLIKEIVAFDSLSQTPDSCLIPDIREVTVGKISPMKFCNGALKMFVVTQKLDSADILPYDDVAETVATQAWLVHRKTVRERLKKEWKMSRPIFSQTEVFSKKDK